MEKMIDDVLEKWWRMYSIVVKMIVEIDAETPCSFHQSENVSLGSLLLARGKSMAVVLRIVRVEIHKRYEFAC